ncbi:MAG: DivIVA domain-containing protein [Desulfobacterales bacterium]|nr:DivIVA domain-containing protein [Desulfobacterales bacterium]
MKTTPLDIQQQQFNVRFRGFDIQEVDNFLEQMANAFESLQNEAVSLNEEIERLQFESKGYKEREETFKRALLNSQKVLEQMKENANKSAELIIADAEIKAEKILQKAHNRLAQLHDDITELKRQRVQIEIEIRSILESHTKLLDITNNAAQTIDSEEAKLKLMKQAQQV